MAADKFRSSEDAYFKLRGQFDTGRITQEQFDEKLRELMVQDAQGRYWMLGADSGKWYFYDGSNWVQDNPPVTAAAVSPASSSTPTPPIAASQGTEYGARSPQPAAAPAGERSFPFVPILVGVAIVVIAILGFLLLQNRDRLFVAQQPPTPITPILPPTITRAPSPTPFGVATNIAIVTGAPTPISMTEVPTLVLPTDTPPTIPASSEPPTVAVTIVIVTIEPTATLASPTLQPSATDTPIPVTATHPPPTRTPSFPPDVYVTALSINPSPAHKNETATFTARFLNTTDGPRNFDWLVMLYDPNKSGPNKGFGESTQVPITIPVGESTFHINHIPATGPGGCVNLYARVGWKISAFEKPIFPNTNGDPITVYFDVCPP